MVIKIEENLKTALKLLSGKRQHEYGNKKENHKNISRLWSAYLDHPISAHDVSILMLLLKVARAKFGNPSSDTYIDMVGYSAIAGELADEDNKKHRDK
jgi:hypothetical protein